MSEEQEPTKGEPKGDHGETSGTVAERPDNVPEKFWKDGAVNTAALLKSYASAEKELGRMKGAAAGAGSMKIDNAHTPPSHESYEEAAQAAGVSIADIWSQVSKGEPITDDQYAKFKEIGYPRFVVDDAIQARSMIEERTRDAVMDAAGGEEEYHKMIGWAKDNLSPGVINAFDNAIAAGDVDAIKQNIDMVMLKQQHEGGKLITGTSSPGGPSGFGSFEEKMAAAKKVGNGTMTNEEYARRLASTPAEYMKPPTRS